MESDGLKKSITSTVSYQMIQDSILIVYFMLCFFKQPIICIFIFSIICTFFSFIGYRYEKGDGLN